MTDFLNRFGFGFRYENAQQLHAASPARAGAQSHDAKVPSHERWTGENRFIVSSDSDRVISMGKRVIQTQYGVPDHNVARMPLDKTSPYGDYSPIVPDPDHKRAGGAPAFLTPTLRDKLTVIGHGSKSDILSHTPEQFAASIRAHGISHIGVLKIDTCYGGDRRLLQRLKSALTAEGVQVGYLSGPRGKCGDTRVAFKIRKLKCVIEPFPVAPSKFVNGIIPESLMLRVVKGNVDVRFPGTRYDLP